MPIDSSRPTDTDPLPTETKGGREGELEPEPRTSTPKRDVIPIEPKAGRHRKVQPKS